MSSNDVWTRAATDIVGRLPAGAISDQNARMLVGMITEAIKDVAAMSAGIASGSGGAIEAIDAPSLGFKIERIWAALAVDDAGEGVCAGPMMTDQGMITAPLIAADETRLDYIRQMAQGMAIFFKKPVRIAKFSKREDIEVLTP